MATLNSAVGTEEKKKESLQEKIQKIANYNPFVKKDGSLVNPYINYQAVADNPNVNNKVKSYIASATGVTPRQIVQPTSSLGTDGYVSSVSTNVYVPSSTSGNALVDTASQYLGTPYVWGGTTPKGFDCSGLVQYVYKQNGVNIPRTSQQQFKSGTPVDANNLQAGDLVFFKGSQGTTTEPGHVGMYIDNGQYIQAPKTGDVVKVSNLADRKDYVGARRY